MHTSDRATFWNHWTYLALTASCLAVLIPRDVAADELDDEISSIKQRMTLTGFPAGGLPSQMLDLRKYDPLALTAAWNYVETLDSRPAETKPHGYFFTQNLRPVVLDVHGRLDKQSPAGSLPAPNPSWPTIMFSSKHGFYEEAALRALFGPSHRHAVVDAKSPMQPGIALPAIRDEFRRRGRTDFDKLRVTLADKLGTQWIGDDRGSADREHCVIVTKWFHWQEPTADWIRNSLRWRGVFTVENVTGSRSYWYGEIQSETQGTRVALNTAVEVGRLSAGEIQPIFRSGILTETNFSPSRLNTQTISANIGKTVYTFRLADTDFHPTLSATSLGVTDERKVKTITALNSPWSKLLIGVHDVLSKSISVQD